MNYKILVTRFGYASVEANSEEEALAVLQNSSQHWERFDDEEFSVITNIVPIRIRIARKRKGLTQEQLASMVGVSLQSISNYEAEEARHREPSVSTMSKIAKALGVTMDWLCGNDLEAAQ